MKIEALCSINNGTFNKGDVFDVSKEEGEALIIAGAAKKAASASKTSEPKQPTKLVDVQASNEGRADKRLSAEAVVKGRKEKKS